MTKCLTVYTALNCCTGWRYIQNRPISLRENSKWDTKTNILVLPFLCPGLKLVFRELYNRYQYKLYTWCRLCIRYIYTYRVVSYETMVLHTDNEYNDTKLKSIGCQTNQRLTIFFYLKK